MSPAALRLLALALAASVVAATLVAVRPLPTRDPVAARDPDRLVVAVVVDHPAPHHSIQPARGAAAAWMTLQLEHHLPVDVVLVALAELDATLQDRATRVVVLEELPDLAPEHLDAVAAFVTRGGTAILMGQVGPPEALDLLGFEVTAARPPAKVLNTTRAVFPSSWGGFNGSYPVVRGIKTGIAWTETELAPVTGGRVVARLEDQGSAWPLLLHHDAGEGQVWMLTLDLGALAWRHHLGRAPGSRDPASWVEWP